MELLKTLTQTASVPGREDRIRGVIQAYLEEHGLFDEITTDAMGSLIGYRKAIDLLFESEFFSAERAVELGIATQLCEPDELLPAAIDRARHLATKPLGSLRWTKRLLLATRQEQVAAARQREDEAFMYRVGSPENLEAVSAFFEKRSRDFSNVPPTDREQ